MKAIIIDDEKKGRETLQALLTNYCEDVNVVALAENARQGFEMVREHNPDIVFLDIEMPNGSGFDFLEKFSVISFKVIFTTAYDSYAIKAIKYHALDYILKPIDIDELKQAVESAKSFVQKPEELRIGEFLNSRKLEPENKLGLPVKDGIEYINVSDIVRIESDGSYSTIYLPDNQKFVVSKNLKEYEDILPVSLFFRAHKSHLINIRKVRKYVRTDGYYVEMTDGSVVEISRRRKDDFLEIMNLQ